MGKGGLRAALLIVIAISSVSCSGAPRVHQSPYITDRRLLSEEVFPASFEKGPQSAAEVFGVSPDMDSFLVSHVTANNGERTFKELIKAMETFGIRYLDYDNHTLTASEAFQEHRGNCLTFTNMFLVMARRAGLKARFQEVRIPPDWILQGNVMVLRRHINVRIQFVGRASEGMRERIVDFDDESIPSAFIDMANRVISDDRALAHFYNNWAAESLERGNDNLAFEYLRKALEEGDPDFAPAWILAGVMYQRAGRDDLAEQSYLRALQAEPDEISAMSNLQRLYERQGNRELSAFYNELAQKHRLKNPYFRLAEARKAYDASDYQAAIEHLHKAISLKPDESDFYFLLSESYAGDGDMRKAAHYLAEGQKLAAQNNRDMEDGPEHGAQRLVKPKALSH